MAYLMLGSVMILLSIVFRLAAVFRLTIPLVYALIVPTVFHEWYYPGSGIAANSSNTKWTCWGSAP